MNYCFVDRPARMTGKEFWMICGRQRFWTLASERLPAGENSDGFFRIHYEYLVRMREALKLIPVPTGAIMGVLLLIALAGSGVAWWMNERVPVLEGGVPLMPRSEVVRAERRDAPAAEIFNYTCNTRRSAEHTSRFYLDYMENTGWNVTSKEENTMQFNRDGAAIRIVLHPQRLKTVFTLHMRAVLKK